jgi:hypothetical protein
MILTSLQTKIRSRRAKRAAADPTRSLTVASQMALICPSGVDVWMQREMAALIDSAHAVVRDSD